MDSEAWTWPESLDALQAAPDSHRLLFENDVVRVLETTIRPGILYVLSIGPFVRRDPEGGVLVDTRDGSPLRSTWSASS